ncbi:MAG: hypothetical protein HQM08_08785 [Candidatus Riflebacteria bacterium]|nr:hypothetical protein [Candidatus Riflebacteria bacterium]
MKNKNGVDERLASTPGSPTGSAEMHGFVVAYAKNRIDHVDNFLPASQKIAWRSLNQDDELELETARKPKGGSKKFLRTFPINARALVSLILLCAGMWLVPSGVALHFAFHASHPVSENPAILSNFVVNYTPEGANISVVPGTLGSPLVKETPGIPGGSGSGLPALPGSSVLQSEPQKIDFWSHLFMAMHNAASIIFLIAAVAHVMLNWSAMKHYVSAKVGEYARFKREMLIAALGVSCLVLVVASHVFFAP